MNRKMMGMMVLAILTLSSCAIKKEAYQKVDKIAVLSFVSNDQVESAGSPIGNMVLRDIGVLDSTLEDEALKLRQQFFKMTPKLIGKVLPEEELLNAPGFKEFKASVPKEPDDMEKVLNFGYNYTTVEGYPRIRLLQRKTMARAFEYLSEKIDGVMVVESTYTFKENNSKVICTLGLRMVNRKADRVIQMMVRGKSRNRLKSKSPEGTLDLLVEEALYDAMSKANRKFMKKL